MTEAGPNHLDRKIALAGAAIAFERVWAALLWPAVVACAAAALVLSGLLTRLPDLPRLALLLVAGLVLLASFRDLFRVSWPSRREAIAAPCAHGGARQGSGAAAKSARWGDLVRVKRVGDWPSRDNATALPPTSPAVRDDG